MVDDTAVSWSRNRASMFLFVSADRTSMTVTTMAAIAIAETISVVQTIREMSVRLGSLIGG